MGIRSISQTVVIEADTYADAEPFLRAVCERTKVKFAGHEWDIVDAWTGEAAPSKESTGWAFELTRNTKG